MSASDRDLYAVAAEVGRRLLERGLTLATAESCTGGWIGKALTDVPGSSAWYVGGFVSYSNTMKASLLGVPQSLLDEEGAVSEAVVAAMADGSRRRAGADLSVAVSGIAGPDGGSAEKPVGTVWFAWSQASTTRAEHRWFDGDRESVRRQTVRHALEGLFDEIELDEIDIGA
jgi:nicotinamide-nucleotide amidase